MTTRTRPSGTSSNRIRPPSNEPVFVISVAADLVGVHPQTLRGYERAGLVVPARTQGGTRRYSRDDIDRLNRIQTLTNQGLTLAGVARVLELERQLAELRRASTALVHLSVPAARTLKTLEEQRLLSAGSIDSAP